MTRATIALLLTLPLGAQTASQKKSVFLIHGIGDTYLGISDLGLHLAGFGSSLYLDPSRFAVDVWFDFGDCAATAGKNITSTNASDYGQLCTIELGAKRLAHYIRTQKPAGNEIVLIGYSMGGLLARYMIADNLLPEYYVSTLITLGTPNMGYPYDNSWDYTERNDTLAGQMYGDFSRISPPANTSLYVPSLPQAAGGNGKACETKTIQGYSVYTSQFLCDLNASWSNLPNSKRPRKWLAASGRLSNQSYRHIGGGYAGCSFGWWEDGVVCEESALLHTYRLAAPPTGVAPDGTTADSLLVIVPTPNYSASANTLPYVGPDEKWTDPNKLFAHIASYASWFLFAGNPFGAHHQALDDPLIGSGLYEAIIADITADAYNVMVTNPVILSPTINVQVGQVVTGSFAIQNVSGGSVTLANLVLGGRLNAQCPNSICPDLGPTVTSLTLAPGQSYSFSGSRQLTSMGHYDFFVAYELSGSNSWITTAPAFAGVANTQSIDVAAASAAFSLTANTNPLGGYQGSTAYQTYILKNITATAGSTVSLAQYIMESTWPNGLIWYPPVGSITMPAAGQTTSFSIGYSIGAPMTPRSYPMELRATNGSRTQNADFNLNVQSAASAPFTLTPASSAINLPQGGTTTLNFMLKNNSATAGSSVSLAFYILANSWPNGLGNSYSSTTTMPAVGQFVNVPLSLSATTALAIGSYPMEMRALQGGTTGIADYTLSVVTATNGSVNVTATKDGTTYTGALSCTLNKPSGTAAISSVPYTLSGAGPGNYSITSCTAPYGTAVANITASQTLTTGGTLNFVVALKTNAPANALSVTLAASNLNPKVGDSVTLTARVSGGSGSGYYCIWGFINTSSCTISVTPTTTSSQTITVTGYDNAGNSKQASVTINVQSRSLTGVCQVNGSSSAQTFQVGNNIVWNANVSGGGGSDNFVWSGIAAGNYQSVNLVPTGAAVYNVSVTVSDSGSPKQQISLTCPLVTVTAPPPLACGCSLSPNPIILGSSSTLYASCVGGTTPYQFLLPNAGGYSNATWATITLTSTGAMIYNITGRDSAGRTATGTCSLTANAPQPVLNSAMPDRNPKAGQPFNLTLYGSGFISGIQGYVCGSTASSSCYTVATNLVNSGQLLLPAVQWNAAGTIYIRVTNPGGLTSGFLTLGVTK